MYKQESLPYRYDSLEPYIDARTMEIHFTKHHRGYVKKLNSALKSHPELESIPVEELLAKPSSIPSDIRESVINNGGGALNHSLFWQIMSKRRLKPSSYFLRLMADHFGSMDNFMELFSKQSLNLFGSGWSWLVVNKTRNTVKLEVVTTHNQNTPLSEGKYPILCLDVWEHAYYLKYQNKRADYIKNWWNVVHWRKIEDLYNKAIQM